MRDPWLPEREPGGDEFEELFAPGREAWRGNVHPADESWRRDSSDESWRGEEHLAEWPSTRRDQSTGCSRPWPGTDVLTGYGERLGQRVLGLFSHTTLTITQRPFHLISSR